MNKALSKTLNENLGVGNWRIVQKGNLSKTTIQWFLQLSESSEGTEEKREAMSEAFKQACQAFNVAPVSAIAARKAMHRADNRETFKAQFSAIRASGE